MGYSLYITRRENWTDSQGAAIELAEWRALVESDPSLEWSEELGEHFAVFSEGAEATTSWLAWERGNLESKHPHKGMIRKMHAIAASLSAQLVGEESESYDSAGNEIPRQPTQLDRQASIWQRLRALLFPPRATDPNFPVGCRVRDIMGRPCEVVAVDLKAVNGLGSITVRYEDGRVASFAAESHGLERRDTSASGT